MKDIAFREFTANGRRIRATLAPREKRGEFGISPDLNTIIFEGADSGEWIGSAAIYAAYPLWSLTNEEIRHYFNRAWGMDGRGAKRPPPPPEPPNPGRPTR